MNIIKPTKVTDAVFTSCTIDEDDYAAWNSATAYVVGNKCILTATHKVYECLVNNSNSIPSSNLTGTTPKWLEVSATNKWKAFDAKIADQSSAADSIGYLFTPGIVDSLALFNLEASLLYISMTDPVEGIVCDKTIDLVATSNVTDFYTYCFEPIIRKTDIAITDLPPYATATVSLSIINTGGTAKVGEIIMGRKSYIGGTEQGCGASIVDYSTKDKDTFGNFIIVPRKFSKRITANLFMPNALVDEVYRLLALYRTTPLVWIADDELSMLMVYGYYKSFEIVVPYPTDSTCSLEIEGLT